MKGRLSGALIGIAVAVALPGMAAGDSIYRLTQASTYQEGCFDPCLCPLLEPRSVSGTFRLRSTGNEDGVDRYAVEDVHWKVPGREPELRVSGSGTYSVESPDATAVRRHRLELDLRLGASAVEHFDSGWRIGPRLPQIQIPISIHGMFCYDRVFLVDAEPVPESQIQPYALVDGSTFQRGCFEPCDCPIGPEQPLAGTFSLLPLADNPLFSEYGMVDARWQVQGGSYATPPDAAITGQGSYIVGGEVAVQQRMEAHLEIADAPAASFDSGWVVGGSGFPGQVDVVISENGQVCFDTVMRVKAKAQPVHEPNATLHGAAALVVLIGIQFVRSRRQRI